MKRQFLWTVLLGFISAGAWAAPVTTTSVSRPKTNTTVTHPTTAVTVSHPQTPTVPVTHPTTAVTVIHPQTSAPVSHPTTDVSVSHPTTAAPVTHPQTTATSSDKSTAPQPTKQAVDNSAPAQAAQKGSMMSNYQAPKAKDLKAAKLGGGEQGLGKTNEAEKDAAAASLKPPKALEFEDTANSNLKSKLTEKVKEKTK